MTTTVAAPARPNTREMIVVHNVFRRILGDLPGLVRAVAPGDTARAGVLADAYVELATGLHHHHTNEDELLWPTLLERVEVERGFVLRAEEQHERVHELLEHGNAQVTSFRATPTAELRDEFAATIEELFTALSEHMADEERYILPLVEEHMTVPEWEQLGERGRAGIPKDRLLIQLGWILDCISPADRRTFLRSMPLPARVLWQLVGRRSFAAEKRKVYGS
jgi:hypothetical protein